jgi:hypothetical protein
MSSLTYSLLFHKSSFLPKRENNYKKRVKGGGILDVLANVNGWDEWRITIIKE